jgi:hypothetical protein
MRRTLGPFLGVSFLFNAAPLMRDRDHGWDPIKIIKKVIRIFVPCPNGDGIQPPKP